MMTQPPIRRHWAWVAALLLATTPAFAAGPPPLTLTPHASRTRIDGLGPLPVYDIKWWIDVHAERGGELTRVEYQARFGDSSGGRPLGGGWDVLPTDRAGFTGRILVTCVLPTDYDRPVRVQLRVRDAAGGIGEWAEVQFPLRAEAAMPAVPTPGERGDTILGTVEVEATDAMTIGEAKEALRRRAREEGGDTTSGFRIARSTGDRITFAADVVRHAAAAPAVVPPTVAAAPDRVLGEIIIPAARQ